MRSVHRCTLAAAMLALAPLAASAQAFDFEGISEGFYRGLTLTSGRQTLFVTAEGDPGWYVIAANGEVPLLGQRAVLGARVNPVIDFGEFAPLRFTFLHPVVSATFAFGDGGGDVDAPAMVRAYDAHDVLLGVFSDPDPDGSGLGGRIATSFGGAAAKYFVLSSGSQGFGIQAAGFNDNSLSWEVSDSAVVPEPAPMALMLGGLLTLALFAGRRRR